MMMKCTATVCSHSLMKVTMKVSGSWASTRVSELRPSLLDPPTTANTEKDHEADGASAVTTTVITMKANGKKASEKDAECNKYNLATTQIHLKMHAVH